MVQGEGVSMSEAVTSERPSYRKGQRYYKPVKKTHALIESVDELIACYTRATEKKPDSVRVFADIWDHLESHSKAMLSYRGGSYIGMVSL